MLVIIVGLAATIGIVYPVGYFVPEQLAILSQGQFSLPVPMTMISTAPNVTWGTVHSQAMLEFESTRSAGAASFRFAWSLATPILLPVVFATGIPDWQSSRFLARPGGAFDYLPAGTCAADCISRSTGIGATITDTSYAVGAVWSFNYSVRLMSRPEGLGTVRFVEVDLSPTSLQDAGTYHPSELGVAPASPSDLRLVTAFSTQSLVTFGFSTNYSAYQTQDFGYSPAPVTLDAGSQGTLSVRMTSAFRWSPLLWEAVSFMGLGGNFSIREYVDLRFGSIALDVGPWVGP